MARAPPEPPSPITTDRIGTRKPNISLKLTAIASPCKGDSLPHQAKPASDANALYWFAENHRALAGVHGSGALAGVHSGHGHCQLVHSRSSQATGNLLPT